MMMMILLVKFGLHIRKTQIESVLGNGTKKNTYKKKDTTLGTKAWM
jgi:hypothetical protein